MAEINIVPKPKRKRGAQPNNLNGARYPWQTFWRKRVVKEHDKWIVPLIEEYAASLLSDRGGADNMTAAERHVVEIAQTARGASMLILKECSDRGLIVETDNGWDLAPGAKELGRFLSLELNALRTIGLDKRAPKVIDSLEEYCSRKYGTPEDSGAENEPPTEVEPQQ